MAVPVFFHYNVCMNDLIDITKLNPMPESWQTPSANKIWRLNSARMAIGDLVLRDILENRELTAHCAVNIIGIAAQVAHLLEEESK